MKAKCASLSSVRIYPLSLILYPSIFIPLLVLAAGCCCPPALAIAPDERNPGPQKALIEPARTDGLLHPSDFVSASHFDRLIVEVDYVSGFTPPASALEGLRTALAGHCSKPAGIEVKLGDEIPVPATWDGTEEEILGLAARHFSPPEGYAGLYTYIICVPSIKFMRSEIGELWGYSIPEEGFICLSQDRINSSAVLHMTAEKILKRVLVHEFGHLLGLVANAAHRTMTDHCVNLDCVMCKNFDRVLMANLAEILLTGETPDRYCAECAEDISKYREASPPETTNKTPVEILREILSSKLQVPN